MFVVSQNYKNMLEYRSCNTCGSRNVCFLRKIPLYHYPEYVQNFVISVPNTIFTYQEPTKQWHANYQAIQEQIVQYYDSNNCRLSDNVAHYLTIEAQKESDRQKIRELFKQYLDMAAKATEDKNSELSIMFDGIGLVLASDYLEIVSKIFSMFKTWEKINVKNTDRCGFELV